MRQFLAESILLCSAGGAIGLVLGYAIVWAASAASGWSVSISPVYVIAALGGGVSAGVTAGIAPAFRAAKLSPVEALRAL